VSPEPIPSPLTRLVLFMVCLSVAGILLAGVMYLTEEKQEKKIIQPENHAESWMLTSKAQVDKGYCDKNVASMQSSCDRMKVGKDRACQDAATCSEQWEKYNKYGGIAYRKPTCDAGSLQQYCSRLTREIPPCIEYAATKSAACEQEYRQNLAAAEKACRSQA